MLPFDGTVETVSDTKHALGLTSASGIELLIHFGLETVALEGRGFRPLVKTGDAFKRGDLLLEVDLKFLQDNGYNTITPVIVTNADDYAEIVPGAYGAIDKGSVAVSVKK